MIRVAAPFALALSLFACAFAAGCAAPGEPTERHPIVPSRITDLGARQYGNSFALTFTLPTRSMDREALPEHPTIEIYRASLLAGAVADKKTAWYLAYTIPSERVDQYLKGTRIEFHDPLTPDDFARATGSSMAYKVRTRAVKARASEDSNVIVEPIYAPPDAPQDVHVDVTESALVVKWADTAAPPGASSRAYRIYRGVNEPAPENVPRDISQATLKAPLELEGTSPSTEFRDSHFEFGTPYVYTVRTTAQFGADSVESADSTPAAVTPRDVFPPATPTNIEINVIPATNQAPAYVILSWAIGSEGDLAGYSVYRSEREDAPGERISTEILPSPTFRDISVVSGKRYYYRVSAVDRAGNESPKSFTMQADVP